MCNVQYSVLSHVLDQRGSIVSFEYNASGIRKETKRISQKLPLFAINIF